MTAAGQPGFHCWHDSCQEKAGFHAFDRALQKQLKDDTAAIAGIHAIEQRTGYENRPDGLFRRRKGGKERVRLGSPLEVIARVRDAESSGWASL